MESLKEGKRFLVKSENRSEDKGGEGWVGIVSALFPTQMKNTAAGRQ